MAMPLRQFLRLGHEIQPLYLNKITRFQFVRYCSEQAKIKDEEEGENFRVLEIKPRKDGGRRKETFRRVEAPPRTLKMPVDQDWTNVWPGPRTFHPKVVPLPIRQGVNKHGPPPSKFANAELMKIPNFLHLTPPAIKKHCNALKEFCTKWPESLQTDEDIEKHFPVQVISSDYCHSSPTIRDPMSRIVTLKFKLSSLELDKHSRDKFLRLVGERYDPKTDYVTITTDSCPMKKQNYDYAHYLLTALYFESWKFEEWEKEKSDEDQEEYVFSERKSNANVKEIFKYNKREVPDTKEFGRAVENWHNNGDDADSAENYKQASLALLSLPSLKVS